MRLLTRAIRVAPRLGALLIACQLTHSAYGVIRDGGIDPANLGKGDWIYQLHHAVAQCNGNVPSVTDVPSLMTYLKNQGMQYIIVKAGTGGALFSVPGYSPQFSSSLVDAAHNAGLKIFGYTRSDGLDIPGESAVADWVFNQGADGFVFDAEIEWESHNLPNNTAKAIQLCSMVRSNWPNKFLAHAPFPYISVHSTFPYKEFGYYCDAVMPQVYFIQIGVTPTQCVNKMNTDFRNWQNGLYGQWRNSIKPIVPLGQGWHGEGTITPALITEFVDAVKNVANPATAGGFKGVNYWVCELHPAAIWPSIATNEITLWTNAPVVANVSADNINSTSATITWTTDQKSDSVVEYGLDTNYGTSVTNSSPIYVHSVTLSGLSPYTTYYYRVKSKNANNQTGVSGVNVFATTAVTAPDVIVESYLPNGALNSNPPYTDAGFVAFSTCKSTAPGLTAPAKVQYATGGSGTPSVTLRPTLPIAGGAYKVYVTHCATSCSADLVASITQSGCSGLPATTPVFQSSYANSWGYVGQMTLSPGETMPTITFTKSGGTLSASSRMYSDGYKFVYEPPPPVGPSIVTQPAATQTNLQGSAASFSVVASGSPPLHYQWRLNGTNIPNAILYTYTRNNVQPADAGTYTVVITNTAGSVTSSPSILVVALPAKITTQPVDTTVGIGMTALFSVTASGTAPLSYQWQFNGTNINGATAAGLAIFNAQATAAGEYAVMVSNPYDTVISSIATLTVMDPFIVTQPQNQSVAAGATATFSVSAVGSPTLSYRWRKEGVDLFDGGRISGAATPTLTVANAQAMDMGNYSVVVSNSNSQIVSSNATLLGQFPPVIVSQPVSQKVVAGSSAQLTAAAVGPAPLVYQWRKGGINLADGGKISGAATATLTISDMQIDDCGDYSLFVENAYGNATSSNALVGLAPLAAWGRNNYTQTDIPAGLNTVSAIAAGFYHCLALRTDGLVAAWGAGMTNAGANPHLGQAVVPDSLSNVVGIAAGYFHSLALRSDGSIAAWGAGTNNSGTSPHYGQAMIPGGLGSILSVAAGGYHSLALKADGTVAAWGAGTTVSSNPHYGQAMIPGGLNNVISIAAGGYHSLALKADGTVVAWGAGTTTSGNPHYGQAIVPNGLTNVAMIAAGGYHNLALKADGTVVAWGDNSYGQTNVPAGLTNAVAISAGRYCSLALKADGTVVAWGDNSYGQTSTPNSVANVIGISSSGYHNLALVNDGRPYITVPPRGQVAAANSNVSLTVMAAGAPPLSYQWQRNGTNIDGATTSALHLAGVQSSDDGNYAVIVSNALGGATSPIAALAVLAPPTILEHPQSLTVNEGGNATFTVTAAGTAPLSYQWQFNNVSLAGATDSHYTRSPVQAAHAGIYAVVVSNALGSVTSSNATLAISVPPGIIAQPQSATVIAGTNITFTVTATGTAPLSYQWIFDGTNIPGATASSYTRINVQPTDAGAYAAIVTNVAGSVTSSNALLTVLVPPVIITQPQSIAVAAGSNATFTVIATGTVPLEYQWRFNGTNLAAATDSAYTCWNVQAENAGSYSVVVSNLAGTVASSEAELTLIPSAPLQIDWIRLTPGGQIQLQVSGGPGDYTLKVTTNLVNWEALTNLTTAGPSFQFLDAETNLSQRYYRVQRLP